MHVQVPGENGAQNDQNFENLAQDDLIFHAEEEDEPDTDSEVDSAAPATPVRLQTSDHTRKSASDQVLDRLPRRIPPDLLCSGPLLQILCR